MARRDVNLKFDNKKKIIDVKIVFYGPALSGKTTTLKYLFQKFGKLDKIKSINTTTGRTLFFDFGIIKLKGIEWDVKFLIYSTTGQDYYAITRPTTLQGADGIIFVADSSVESFNRNLVSWRELVNLYGEKLLKMPIVCNFNKQDLLRKFNFYEFLEKIRFEKYKSFAFFKTIALLGDGVVNSFKKTIELIFPGLIINQISI